MASFIDGHSQHVAVHGGEALKAEIDETAADLLVDGGLMLQDAFDEAFGIQTRAGLGGVEGPKGLQLAFFGLPVHVEREEVLNGGFAAFAAFSHGVSD
jgi:hypothetical protein